jgi:HD superfamily phosphohydrolase
MPQWGVNSEDRDPQHPERWPWGLAPEWLAPAKVVTDPVHGDIYLNALESALVSSRPMRRLARVRQLGTAHLVYPGAVHTRLSHAIGTLRAAQDLLDAVVDARNGPRPPEKDFFAGLAEDERSAVVAEATVAARLGALLHDLCHVPFGHTIEDDLRVLKPHDANVGRFDVLWGQLPADVREAIDGAASGALKREVRGLILSKEGAYDICPVCRRTGAHRPDPGIRYPFVADIVGNTICADLIDYLQRDHLHCGLPIGLGHRFINGFYVMNNDHVHFARRMVVQVTRDGQRRADVLSELVKYLRYRYELSERVLNHHAKIAADAMLSKMLEMWADDLFVQHARSLLGPRRVRDPIAADVETVRNKVAATEPRTGLDANGADVSLAVLAVDDQVRAEMEHAFTTHSDDGLLELLAQDADRRGPGLARREAVATLARDVLDRRLFKVVAVAAGQGDRALADLIYKAFGPAGRRRELERAAMGYAGLSQPWRLVLWVPEPRMRMKVADVLCDDDGNVAPLSAIRENDSDTVLEQHKRLWSVVVYAHPALRDPAEPDASRRRAATYRLDAALSFLRHKMDLDLVTWNGAGVPTPDALAADLVADELGLRRHQRDELLMIRGAALVAEPNFDSLLLTTWETAKDKAHVEPDAAFPF